MSALNDLSKITGNANSYLSMKIAEYEDARIELTKAHENQSVAVRALAAVAADHDAVSYGQELELRAVQALANVEVGRRQGNPDAEIANVSGSAL